MRTACLIVCMFAFRVSGAPPQGRQYNGSIAPKLSMVAIADGKQIFFFSAFNYCTTLGMKLAEISSASQFLALDQAALGEDFMVGSAYWTGGVEAKGVRRYVWESTNASVSPAYLPFQERLTDVSENALVFFKYLNMSFVKDSRPTSGWLGVLCETTTNSPQYLQYIKYFK